MDEIDLTQWIIKDFRKNNYSVQIEEFILNKIKSHAVHPGEQIPSIRVLAKLNGVNKNTVHGVYTKLISKGWLSNSPGRSTTISLNSPKIFNAIQRIETNSLHTLQIQPDLGRIKQLWPAPIQDFVSIGPLILNEVCSADSLLSKYAKRYREKRLEVTQAQNITEDNSNVLQNSVLEHIKITRGLNIENKNLHIIKGRIECIKSIFHLLFTSEDLVINTSPGDYVINWVIKEGRIKTIKIDPTESSFVKNLTTILQKNNVKAVYIRPGCTYPKGISLDIETCQQLIALAKKYHFIIIEEDDDHEFWYGQNPFKPLIDYDNEGHIIHLAALSRLTPNMQNQRTVIAPDLVIQSLKSLPALIYEGRDITEEMAISEAIKSGELAALIRKARKFKRRDLINMEGIFHDHLSEFMKFRTPETGLSIWLEFTNKVNLKTILTMLKRSGIQVPYFPEQQRHAQEIFNMRLSFSLYHEQECLEAATKLQKIYYKVIKSTS